MKSHTLAVIIRSSESARARTECRSLLENTVRASLALFFAFALGGAPTPHAPFTATAATQTITLTPQVPGATFHLNSLVLQAGQIVVSNSNNSGPGSLRQAIADAALTPGADTITFAPALSGQSIALSGVADAVNGASALLISDTTGGVTLDATALPGGLTLNDGTGFGYRAFRVAPGSSLTLRGLTVSGFSASGETVGGAILNSGTLTLTLCTLSRNFADSGGAIFNASGGTLTLMQCALSGNSGLNGGVIHNLGAATLTLCTLSGNNAANGGTIFNSATLTLTQCTLTANSVTINGGAIYSFGGSVSLTHCTLSGNSSEFYAGAIIMHSGVLTLTHCTLASNSAYSEGGAIRGSGTLTLTHCTLAGNYAGSGGAIRSSGGLTLTHCTLAGNSAHREGGAIDSVDGTLTLANTIAAGNAAPTGPDIRYFGGIITTAGVNLLGNLGGSGLTAGPSILTGPAQLGPLGDFGGVTLTMPLRPGSPARNAASTSTSTTDQRGFPIVGLPDIGAYEAGTLGTNYNTYIYETLPVTATEQQHASTADFDRDGQSNEAEWLTLTDAANANSRFTLTISANVGGNLRYTFATALGRTYTLESSTNLITWNSAGIVAGTGSTHSNVTGSVTAFPRYFLRVKATLP